MVKFSRRSVLGAGGLVALGGAGMFWGRGGGATPPDGNFAVRLSEEQWRRRLSPAAYRVLRGQGTERAGSSPLDREKRRGTFLCAGCGHPLFSSATKFDSGTGWPSFFRPLPGAIGTRPDDTLFMRRTEVHCARCGGHIGHVFDDGPRPTGLRYCMNGVAITFRPAARA